MLLQDAGVLYMTLKAASGGQVYAQFVCQRLLPTLGLNAQDIEGAASDFVAEFLLVAHDSAALVPPLMSDDAKALGPAIVAVARARRLPA